MCSQILNFAGLSASEFEFRWFIREMYPLRFVQEVSMVREVVPYVEPGINRTRRLGAPRVLYVS